MYVYLYLVVEQENIIVLGINFTLYVIHLVNNRL